MDDIKKADLELKHMLAKEMRGKFSIYNKENEEGICWSDTDKPVGEMEWEWIVRAVESNLTNDEKTLFIRFVNGGDFSYRRLAFASWQRRAAAYFTVKGRMT